MEKILEVKEYIARMSKGAFVHVGSMGVLRMFHEEEDAHKFFGENKEELGLQEVVRYRCIRCHMSYTEEEYNDYVEICDDCDSESFAKDILFQIK